MQRIVKRFLLHNQRESEGFKKGFIEFKQDLQMCRYELLNGMKAKKENIFHVQNLTHAGLNILGDELFHKRRSKKSDLNYSRFNEYKKFSQEITLLDDSLASTHSARQQPLEVTKAKILCEAPQMKTIFRKKSFYTIVRMAMIKQGLPIPKLTPSQKASKKLSPLIE